MSERGAARAIAFHLPQFHPIPENDEWWGPGFTEWTNVRRAQPLFPGHRQPVLPAYSVGFYDLRDEAVRRRQVDDAKSAGLEAFCFWHYWFAGRRLLDEVVDRFFESDAEIGMMLGWANQTWTGIWHGASDRVLVEQTYPEGDDERHFAAVRAKFEDARYVRVEGKPVFYVYEPNGLPSPSAFVERWQGFASAAGLGGLYLVAEAKNSPNHGVDLLAAGFDAVADVRLPGVLEPTTNPLQRLYRRAAGRRLVGNVGPTVYDMRRLSPKLVPAAVPDDRVLPCVIPQWDNTPRSGERGRVLFGATPQLFEDQVRAAVRRLQSLAPEKRLFFVKSWNEWAETNHVEPDDHFARGLAEALRSGLNAPTAAS